MKVKITVLIIVILMITQAWGIEPVAKIIKQQDAPLVITSYSANYEKGNRYTTQGIHHFVEFKNTSDKTIVAVQIGLVSFDIWNEFIDRTGGISINDISAGESEKGTWVASAYGDFSFLTGFAYVNKVRFSDGIIWSADLNLISEEMRKIEKDFDVQKLKGKPEKN